MNVLLLGAGRVGATIARDLAASAGWQVTVADRSSEALGRLAATAKVATTTADLADPAAIAALARDHHLVVGALPSFLGYRALEAVLQAGRDYVDISFFEEDPFTLGPLAQARGVTAVVDCGVAPGCDNLILGHLTTQLERIDRFTCWVGGLPAVRTLPWEYKAPFAPYDVLNEYLRPARYVEGGELVVTAALDDLELIEIPGVGTLEGFLTDGLRTLLTTVQVPFMKEKTLRYPGHAEKIRLLEACGFLSESPLALRDTTVTPLEVTSRLLFPHWELGDDEEDLTALRIEVEGLRAGEPLRLTYDLVDRRDAQGTSAMARTTGFTCAAVARLVASRAFDLPGVWAPEHVGMAPGCHDRVLAELAERGIRFQVREEPLRSSAGLR
jgi:lysine 6-dehydrogenase